MEAQKKFNFRYFVDPDKVSLDLDFNNDGKVDEKDYKMALEYMKNNGTENAFGFEKNQLDNIFAHFVMDFSENSNTPISISDGNSTFHFYEDRDNNGILDDRSELLGAKDGFAELQAYDLDGNGKIDGDELKNLKLVKVDNKTGEFKYMTAKEAGIDEIDLTSLVDMNAKQISESISDMALDVKMLNGETFSAIQNEGLLKSIEEEMSGIFGTKITDLPEEEDDVSYMENFVKGIDIQGQIDCE